MKTGFGNRGVASADDVGPNTETHSGPQGIAVVVHFRACDKTACIGFYAAADVDDLARDGGHGRIPGLKLHGLADRQFADELFRNIEADEKRATVVQRGDERVRSNAVAGVDVSGTDVPVEHRPEAPVL